jgi:predicted YcjX-like family ATPase
MFKAKMTALAVAGIALAGLGGSVIGPAPVQAAAKADKLTAKRLKQCLTVLEPATDHADALAAGEGMDSPGADYKAFCAAMTRYDAILTDDARNLAVCEGIPLEGQDEATVLGLLSELKYNREAIAESRRVVCQAANPG